MSKSMHTVSGKSSDGYMTVEYGLETIGDQSPYFSVTASEWGSLAHARRWPDNPHSAGAMHDEILRAFPDLAAIVALHLADIDGAPMHAVANGWYWYERGEWETLAQHLRMPVADLPAPGADRETITNFINAQRERWSQEAAAARARYNLVTTAHGRADEMHLCDDECGDPTHPHDGRTYTDQTCTEISAGSDN